jgi:hypothetical protein
MMLKNILTRVGTCGSALLCFCVVTFATSARAQTPTTAPTTSNYPTWNPDPSLGNPDQHRHLYDIARKYCETNFDPDANLVGVGSKHPPNKKSHSTRESAYYAYGLLLTGDADDRARAQAILKRVVATQDTTSDGLVKGAFGWYAEEPPKDLNSAAFVGVTLADVIDLDRRKPCLDPNVRTMVENAAKLAVLQVMHRDVDPGYTNIAMLSIALTAAGQKLWAMPVAAAWSEAKLDAMMSLADDGEFAEYLSPTYTGVAVDGAYLTCKFAFSDSFAAKATANLNHLWKQVALSYHAPTFQLGGPYQRAYGDNMLDYAADLKYPLYLALDGAYPLPDTDTDHDWDKAGLFTIADLPIGPRDEFKQPSIPWRQWTAVGTPPIPVRNLSQYRDGNFILGTVGTQDEWKQKRNLVAYWRNPDTSPDGFSVGFCIDQTNETVPPDYAGAKLNWYCQQAKDAALVAIVGPQKPPASGGCTLVFDTGASAAADGKETPPLRILDGTITTYLFPVSNAAVHFYTQTSVLQHVDAQANTKRDVFKVTRPWESADNLGSQNVIAYLVVFRPSSAPAPNVSGLALKPDQNGTTAVAKVDGVDLSVWFKQR